jgi:hypothetical protein
MPGLVALLWIREVLKRDRALGDIPGRVFKADSIIALNLLTCAGVKSAGIPLQHALDDIFRNSPFIENIPNTRCWNSFSKTSSRTSGSAVQE